MESQKINISIVKEFFSTIKKSCKLIQKCSCFLRLYALRAANYMWQRGVRRNDKIVVL